MPRDNTGNEIVVVEGTFKYSTTKATLLRQVNGSEYVEHWFPISQMKKPSILTDKTNEEWAIFIPRWLAQTKSGLSYDDYDQRDWPAHTCDKETGEIPELGTLDDFDE